MEARTAHVHAHRVQLLVLQALLAMVASFGGDDIALAFAADDESPNPFTMMSVAAVEEHAVAAFDRAAAVTSVLQSASEEWQRMVPDWTAPHL